MDIFFTHRRKYKVNDNVDNVRANLQGIADRKWNDFSNNITGRLNADDSFKLTHKWSFAVFRWIENSPAYLSGTLTTEGNKTIIQTSLRPNSIFVMFFYLFTVLFLCEAVGIDTFFQGPKSLNLLFFAFFNLVLFGLIKMYTSRLRNRFERLLQLQHDQ
jgi:hypothetical protein